MQKGSPASKLTLRSRYRSTGRPVPMLASFTFPGYATYAAMKGGIEVLTRYMAKELGPRAIAVNTIAPGAIETDFNGAAVRDNAQLNAQIASVTAPGRAGLADDVGAAVAALLSDGNRWITGSASRCRAA
jgi:NAD(P)-dependent dehydrogenase (short-subunit alcohol dehydrogenase family)